MDIDKLGSGCVLRISDLHNKDRTRRRLLLHRKSRRESLGDILTDERFDDEAWIFYDHAVIDDLVDRYHNFVKTIPGIVSRSWSAIFGQGNVVFEGAQGALLDELHGFYPYTTWSDTTTGNADRLIRETDRWTSRQAIGVMRAYATRHGAGPLPTEDPDLTAEFLDDENGTNPWQGDFRVGWTDLVLARHGANVFFQGTRIAERQLAITHLDRVVGREWRIADSYLLDYNAVDLYFLDAAGADPNGRVSRELPEKRYRNTIRWGSSKYFYKKVTDRLHNVIPHYQDLYDDHGDLITDVISTTLDVPVAIRSYGPTSLDKTPMLVTA